MKSTFLRTSKPSTHTNCHSHAHTADVHHRTGHSLTNPQPKPKQLLLQTHHHRPSSSPFRHPLCQASSSSSPSSTPPPPPHLHNWSLATVVENRAASADGSVRTIVLSIEDAVPREDGLRVKHVQESLRWIDAYRLPGQLVALRYPSTGATAQRLFALANSPYEARRESAMLDGAIVELLVSRNGDDDPDEHIISAFVPGSQIEVSEVLGQGYGSLFNSNVVLNSMLEENRPLLMIAMGARGIAPLHAALSWTPVLAHATAHKVALYYIAEKPASACYLVEFDEWRDAGVLVNPLYMEDQGGRGVEEVLEEALFGKREGLLSALGGGCKPSEAAVLMSGLPGSVAGHLTRRLTTEGKIPSERLLFCDFSTRM